MQLMNISSLIGIDFVSSPSGITYATWNPLDKSVNTILSNGNLTATETGGIDQQVRATIGKSSGKWYWELTSVNMALEANSTWGISQITDSLDTSPGYGPNSYALANGYGGTWHDRGTLGFGGYNTYTTALTDDTVTVGFALDMDAGTLEIYFNGVSQGIAFTGLTGTFYPASGSYSGYTLQTTANFGATWFSYPVPDGFNAGIY